MSEEEAGEFGKPVALILSAPGKIKHGLHKLHCRLIKYEWPEATTSISETKHAIDCMVNEAIQRFGRIDIVISCQPEVEVSSITDADYFGKFEAVVRNIMIDTQIVQSCSKHMSKDGLIVNITRSVDGILGTGSSLLKNMSSAGASMLTQTAANAMAVSGIRIVTIRIAQKLHQQSNEQTESLALPDLIDMIRSNRYIHGTTITINSSSQ